MLAMFCASVGALANPPTIRVDALAPGGMVIGRSVSCVKDTAGNLTINDVTSKVSPLEFSVSDQDSPNFGYDKAPHWLRFTIDPGARDAELVLEVGQPSLDTVELYSPRAAGGFDVQAAGDQIAWDARPVAHRNHVFRLAINAGAPATYYLRVASAGALIVPLTLYSAADFAPHDRDMQLLFGLFYGLIIAMFLYNLFIFLSLRDRVYLWYVGYVGNLGLGLFALDGFAFEYLWPRQVWWANHALGTLLAAALFFACLFGREFLNSRRLAPQADRLLAGFIWVVGAVTICAATGFVLEYGAVLRVLSAIGPLGAFLTLWIGIKAILRGYRPARYFLLAWGALLVFVTIGAMRNFAILPANFMTTFGLHIGLGLDVILLSMALAARIRSMQGQVIDAQGQLIDAAQEHRASLEARARELGAANNELESFSHTVAHDLRAPLRAIDGFANLLVLEHGKDLDGTGRRDVAAISRNARRMALLVDGLLEFSRLGRVAPGNQVVDMRALVESVLEDLIAGQDVAVRIGELRDVTGDALLLRQVWANLIDNAFKFSRRSQSPAIDVDCEVGDTEVVFSVSDNGAGFDPLYADKLFGMFQRLHAVDDFPGNGVGLAIVRRIVERHGGRVAAAANPGGGARFTFALPRARLVMPARSRQSQFTG